MIMKGFITIATGDYRFKKLAYNLKKSYDLQYQATRYPWAIITDNPEQIFSVFEKIVILPHATCSYMDKLSMLSMPPWDENIFIDADSLIYGDISMFFNFSPFCGVKHMGVCLPITSKGKGWFDIENVGRYREKVSFIIHSHGGLIFFDKSNTTYEVYKTSIDIVKHWSELKFREFSSPADEPILALSMAVHNCAPIEDNLEKYLCFYRVHKKIKQIDISKGILSYVNKWDNRRYDNVGLVHWGNQETSGYLYKSEVLKLDRDPYWFIYKYCWFFQDIIISNFNVFKSYLYKLLIKKSK